MAYDTDYFVTVTTPVSLPWNVPIGSEQFLNIKMIKATNQQTPIEEEFNDKVKYTLRAYQRPSYVVKCETYNEIGCIYQNTDTGHSPFYVYAAKVVISAVYSNNVTITTCDGTFQARNPVLSSVTWNDGNELQFQPYISSSTGYFSVLRVVGEKIEAMPGETPSDPNWQHNGPGVTVTSYGLIKATVRDNWGYNDEISVNIPPKVVYGTP